MWSGLSACQPVRTACHVVLARQRAFEVRHVGWTAVDGVVAQGFLAAVAPNRCCRTPGEMRSRRGGKGEWCA
jgi:hypothetical protein